MNARNRLFQRSFVIIVILLTIWYGQTQWKALQALKLEKLVNPSMSDRPTLLFAIISLTLILAIFLFTKLTKQRSIKVPFLQLPLWTSVAILLIILILAISYLFLTTQHAVWGVSGRLLLFIWIAGFGAWLLHNTEKSLAFEKGFLASLLIAAVLYRISLFIPDMQSTPFSLGWSEGSRYSNAALFFSKSLFGIQYPLPVLHPARYLLQSFPFLIAPRLILIHRIWQVLLWLGLTSLGAISLVKRLAIKNQAFTSALVIWLFLYFFQGAVYYHLMVIVALLLFGYKGNAFWRNVVIILLASIWAGLSRINWFPVPGLLATAIYFLEEPLSDKHWFKYLRLPILWTFIGTLTAYLTNQIYAAFSGNDIAQFSSSFSSYMIWSRLFPNATFNLGVLPALLLVSLPLIIISWYTIKNRKVQYYWNWLRVLGLAGILAVFGIGGIIVSVKIGGGGDLHNLDAFLVFLVVIALYLIFDRYSPQSPQNDMTILKPIPFFYILFLVLVPVYFTLRGQSSWIYKDLTRAKSEVVHLQHAVDIIEAASPGPILFISESQLYTFKEIRNINFDPQYEKVFLMEMVMSHNQPFLTQLQQKIQERKYAAIITDSIFVSSADSKEPFWVENNLWVDKIVIPILEDYELVLPLQDGAANLLIPRDQEDLFNRIKKAE